MGLALELQDSFDVTIIDKNDYFEAIAATLKFVSDDEWLQKITIQFSEVAKGNKLNFVQATLSQVNTNNSIDIVKPDGS